MADEFSPGDLSVMQGFIEAHGTPPADNPPTSALTPSAAPAQPTAQPPDDEVVGLDDATLQALGLMPPDAPAASDEDGATTGAAEALDLAALAQALGLDADDLLADPAGGVKLKTKVDGETAEVSLAELRKGYQLQKHFTRQQEQFLAEQRQWEQARQQQEQQLQQQAALATEVLRQEEQTLTQQYTLDWDALRKDDPAEYAAMVAEYNQKLAVLRQRQQSVIGTLRERQEQQEREQAQADQALLQREQALLYEAMGWKDAKEAQTHAQKLIDYFKGPLGLTEQQIGRIRDHRLFVAVDKAAKYDELMQRVALSKKRVAEAPVMPAEKSTAAPRAASPRRVVDESLARLRKDHSVDSAADVFLKLKVV